ncbi:exodeoxyribonuclease VII large subunit [Asticcacaulis sp. AC460]|uniref:exodeoxyribonuclease VII large subunit n=1 Tax=Asticcacaulis sp. AC460 TaxID=1282360 RepID=UPI0003C3BE7B|nr:exodeoxyribonuclease VII large subunit [Asticcacaulis sp. AC460]ESQ87725.1 exodeoxyribonuclease VII large subunit [Asticcacaulis sp. AC460]
MPNDLLTAADSPAGSNAPAYSVSELAGALKRTLEQTYDHVRLRGEISKVTRHASGHVYLTLKDDKANIDGVIWKGQVSRLQTQPDYGLEVIVTGRITTFPASSKYQIVIEQMEAAGVGALLAQLERLKQKLNAEGLFRPERKKPLPFAPRTIGVITSPTGAVIRDILHRIRDRWPCRVIVWPVVVQGDAAPPQVINALRGFESGAVPRPDVIIVARGGGSVEDLWPFNDEALARAVFECSIPVISAVGHETDTTLIDHVSDRRAPTPTGAAELATPVIGELRAFAADLERRRQACMSRGLETRREKLALLARALPRPTDLIDTAQQRLDFVAQRLAGSLSQNLNLHGNAFTKASARLSPLLLTRQVDQSRQRLNHAGQRLDGGLKSHVDRATARFAPLEGRLDGALTRRLAIAKQHARLPDLERRMDDAMQRLLVRQSERLQRLDQLRLSLSPTRPLDLGFALVERDGHVVTQAAGVSAGDVLTLTFKDGKTTVTAGEGSPPPKSQPKKPTPPPQQGSLF